MKNLFKYIGLLTILLFGFYYTEKINNKVISNTNLMKEINKESRSYNTLAVNAFIEGEYIIPGLNGYAVNVLKSYNKMKYINTFNSNYLVYDLIKPNISLEDNKEKIIKYGNSSKESVSIIVKNNKEVLDYIKEKSIKITRLYDDNDNNDICYIKNTNNCNDKYIFEESITLNNYNLSSVKKNIKSGYIIYVNDNVSLSDFKLLIKQIYYQNLNIIYLSDLIKE